MCIQIMQKIEHWLSVSVDIEQTVEGEYLSECPKRYIQSAPIVVGWSIDMITL